MLRTKKRGRISRWGAIERLPCGKAEDESGYLGSDGKWYGNRSRGAGFPGVSKLSCYAAPNLTDTSFDTPGSCIVTP